VGSREYPSIDALRRSARNGGDREVAKPVIAVTPRILEYLSAVRLSDVR
jgi:hypothetical protein